MTGCIVRYIVHGEFIAYETLWERIAIRESDGQNNIFLLYLSLIYCFFGIIDIYAVIETFDRLDEKRFELVLLIIVEQFKQVDFQYVQVRYQTQFLRRNVYAVQMWVIHFLRNRAPWSIVGQMLFG